MDRDCSPATLRWMVRVEPFETRRIEKPWGYEVIWAETELYVGKLLHIDEGQQTSLQFHEQKDETIYVDSGLLRLEVGDSEESMEVVEVEPGESFHFPPGRRHRMSAIESCDLMEVSTPHLQDVVRLEDRYGRSAEG